MKFLPLLSALFAVAPLLRAAEEELKLVGMMQASKGFVIFVSLEGQKTAQMNAVGAFIGPFELVAVDPGKGYADFKHKNGDQRRIWLPEGFVRSGASAVGTVLSLPPLETIKGLIGLEEAIARGGRAAVEKRLLHTINLQMQDPSVPLEERSQRLADLISGNRRNVFVPAGGVDEAFAKKYGLTPMEVANANWGEEVGREFAKSEKKRKAADKK